MLDAVGGCYELAKTSEGSSDDGVNSPEQVVVLGVVPDVVEPVKMMVEASSKKGVNALGQVMMVVRLSVPGEELGSLECESWLQCCELPSVRAGVASHYHIRERLRVLTRQHRLRPHHVHLRS
jgi:hypothetical protein